MLPVLRKKSSSKLQLLKCWFRKILLIQKTHWRLTAVVFPGLIILNKIGPLTESSTETCTQEFHINSLEFSTGKHFYLYLRVHLSIECWLAVCLLIFLICANELKNYVCRNSVYVPCPSSSFSMFCVFLSNNIRIEVCGLCFLKNVICSSTNLGESVWKPNNNVVGHSAYDSLILPYSETG